MFGDVMMKLKESRSSDWQILIEFYFFDEQQQ